ncbi:MAG TPA: TetR/AcrR family transcriptional regulator [Allosphingosinicella sp.]|jgi:AcrR family transcriptional regulator
MPTRPYHHGNLRQVILASAGRILERDGISGLTLRAAAREAGVSHAAPKNHFGDLAGLLSELAAIGFVRLRTEMLEDAARAASPSARLHAIGRRYVRFAAGNPALFLLMFRGERLDRKRPALRDAMAALLAVLAAGTGGTNAADPDREIGEREAREMVLAWSQVHGLAMLLIDGRLKPITNRLPENLGEEEFLSRLLDPDLQG